MAEKNKHRFAEAKKLVYIHSIIPERSPGEGAILVLRDGSFRMIIKTGSVNFDMKSPMERLRLTYGFGALCDSLEDGFPIQILSHSKLVDVSSYTEQYQQRLANQNTPEAIRKLIIDHLQHFGQQVEHSRIMQRELYVVLPWKGAPRINESSVWDDIPFASMFGAVRESVEEKMALEEKPTDMEISLAQQQLDVRCRHISARLNGLNIWTKPLGQDDVRRLIYSYFHPGLSERQRDPGFVSSNVLGGFSIQGTPRPQRRLTDGGPMEAPKF